MTKAQKRLLQISIILWGVWGLVHIMAGTIVLSADIQTGFSAIAGAVYAQDLIANYRPAVGATLNQHAWNLFWFGGVTALGAFCLVGFFVCHSCNDANWWFCRCGLFYFS